MSFNLTPSSEVARLAEQHGVRIVEGSIIYRLVDDVKSLLEDRLPPIVSSRVLGQAEIADIFEIDVKKRGKVKIAGCKIRNGVIERGSKVRVIREGKVVYEGMRLSFPFLMHFAPESCSASLKQRSVI